MIMSVSCSDNRFADLLCSEESSEIFSGKLPESLKSSSEIDSSPFIEESIAGFIEEERNFVPGVDYLSRFRSQSLDLTARKDSVAWILKVHAHYGFQPLTAYLAVNYLDRFLYSRRLPQTNGWPLQLLAVACLSLAAKMEESLVPSLLDLQVEVANFIFKPRTIRQMELLVLSVLDWRLRSVTPFSYISFFAFKIDSTGAYLDFLLSRSSGIILSNIKDASFLEFWPSSIAAAAILCAANEIPNLSLIDPEHAESWCDGLNKDKIMSCYRLMQDLVINNHPTKTTKALQRLRVTLDEEMMTSDPSSSLSAPFKRRNLGNQLWVDDNKGDS